MWSFSGGQDGCKPNPALTAVNDSNSAKKTLWGLTDFGGRYSNGTVFKLADGKLSTQYNFTGGADGGFPTAITTDKSGAIYGTTAGGGAFGSGTVFKIDAVAGTFTTVWSFSGADGSDPAGPLLIDDNGAIYGTTGSGGLTNASNAACYSSGCGTVFKLTPPKRGQAGWTLTTLYFFTGNADGAIPTGPYFEGGVVADKSGALYGTTYQGGTFGSLCGSWGCGVVFKLTPPASGQAAWTQTVIWSFSGYADGNAGNAPLVIDRNGALYGTTQYGGYLPCFYSGGFGCGNVFKLTPPAAGQSTWTETTLWGFTGLSDGQSPLAGLVADRKGGLYGTTTLGGTFSTDPPCQDGCGLVFKLDGTGFAPGGGDETAAQ